jgi:peptidoglycan hydrolase CwlO-like protein
VKALQAKIKALEAEIASCRAGGDSAGKEAEQWKTKATKLEKELAALKKKLADDAAAAAALLDQKMKVLHCCMR